ncbi:hypothetical protein [Nocardioides sp.]|uniref:hypothetical protein n=1 Tax=Nocardioides sp. TaxID=35761 RepID=UPI002ED9F561
MTKDHTGVAAVIGESTFALTLLFANSWILVTGKAVWFLDYGRAPAALSGVFYILLIVSTVRGANGRPMFPLWLLTLQFASLSAAIVAAVAGPVP